MRCRLAAGLVAAASMAAGLATTPGSPAGAQLPEPVTGVHWQSAGDSYSSGEGVPGNAGGCAQSASAYGPAAAEIQRDDRDWTFASETFTACTGHLVEDFLNARPGEVGDDGSAKGSLWQWGREQGGPERVDVLALSFGGNDIGFADHLSDCVFFLPDSWTSPKEYPTVGTGCDRSEDELRARIDALSDPTRSCTGGRHVSRHVAAEMGDDHAGGFACDLQIDWAAGRRGSIIDFYHDLVTQRLTRRGQLYVVGYPRLFAPPSQWDAWVKVACQGVKRGDTETLGRLAEHLNDELREAVERANQALGATRVHFVDRLESYRFGGHELCGSGEDWLNGLARDRGDGTKRTEMSFHPNEAGHADTAIALAQLVSETLPQRAPLTDAELVDLAGCSRESLVAPHLLTDEASCAVTGRVPLDHPRWGDIELVTVGPEGHSSTCAERALFAVDAAGSVVWDPGVGESLCPLYGMEPASAGGSGTPVDAAGRIFVRWNPGRYDGITALTVTDDGFDGHHTIPDRTYDTRFYDGAVVDVDGDGVWEVSTNFAPCYNCAFEPVFTFTHRWDGEDFAVVVPPGPVECGTVDVWDDSRRAGSEKTHVLTEVVADGVSCLHVHLREDGGEYRQGLVEEFVDVWDASGRPGSWTAAGFGCKTSFDGAFQQFECRRDGGRVSFIEWIGGAA